MTTVILAEKPDQARKYMDGLGIKHTAKQHLAKGSTFLDPNTVVVSAAGHLLELCEPEHYGKQYEDRDNIEVLPIMPSRFDYDLPKSNVGLYSEIKREIEKANTVIVSTDMDNEGGAIAFNILRFSGMLKQKKILRSYPTALNKQAVVRQFKNLKPIDKTWRDAHAAIARSRSDWLIGMNLSRLYTGKLKNIGIIGNYAVGRSISTVLNLICQWEKSIEDFKEEPIYELTGKTNINGKEIDLKSTLRMVGEKNKTKFISTLKAHGLTSKRVNGTVALIDTIVKETFPPIMFTKGDLYKEMNRVAGWTQARSKNVMQKNYDDGYQTYPRTDAGEIPRHQYEYLKEGFDNYLHAIGLDGKFQRYEMPEDKLKKYLVKEGADDAHYGIVPTEKIMGENDDVTDDQRLMYEVVVRKALTMLIKPYQYVSNRLGIKANDIPMIAQNNAVLDPGWKAILMPSKKKSKTSKKGDNSKEGFDYSKYVSKGQVLPVALKIDVGKTQPPKPLKSIQIYDKGGIMEKAYKYVENKEYAAILKKTKGIGTSATRDQALASLIAKKYITVDTKDVITVTANGWLMNKLLEGSEVSDPTLTAKWEEEYKRIDEGKSNSNALIQQTAKMVYSEIKRVNAEWNTQEIIQYYESRKKEFDQKVSLGKCPVCGSDVIFTKDTKNSGKWDAYRCRNKDCKFTIFKHFSNRNISEADVKKLLDGKTTHKFKNILAKSGKHYDAKLILEKDDKTNQYKLKPVFD